jgi:hypothetical protein
MVTNRLASRFRWLGISIVVLFVGLFPLSKKAAAMSIVLSIPEKYGEVQVGEKLYFQTEVKWPENVGRKDLRVEYSVRDQNDKEVAYLKVLKAIETQASFMDSIAISESTPPGTYRIYAKFSDYGDLSQEVTASFTVARGDVASSTYIYIIIGLIGIIVLVVINTIYLLVKRSKGPAVSGLVRT